jgi:assimilatory nitrate reductase catalytic subunit
VAVAGRGRQVCTCLDVTDSEITTALRRYTDGDSAARLARLQGELRCGTQCGSCVPELKRLVQLRATADTAVALGPA